jgi:Flp pilus assembly protein TadG
MRLKRSNRRRESGQSAVELALTLPLLLLLICGMIEMGWLTSTRLVLDNITREGVRAGIIATSASANTDDVIARINEMKPDYMTGTLNITVSYSDSGDFREGDITVVTTYDLPTLTPLTAFLADNGVFHLRSTCTMKMS